MRRQIITIEFEDPSDGDWLEGRLEAAIEDKIADAKDEGRLDGKVEATSERDDG